MKLRRSVTLPLAVAAAGAIVAAPTFAFATTGSDHSPQPTLTTHSDHDKGDGKGTKPSTEPKRDHDKGDRCDKVGRPVKPLDDKGKGDDKVKAHPTSLPRVKPTSNDKTTPDKERTDRGLGDDKSGVDKGKGDDKTVIHPGKDGKDGDKGKHKGCKPGDKDEHGKPDVKPAPGVTGTVPGSTNPGATTPGKPSGGVDTGAGGTGGSSAPLYGSLGALALGAAGFAGRRFLGSQA